MANLNLQQLITDSPLSEDLKARMLLVAPRIEKNFSEYLSKVFSRQDIFLGAEELAYDIEVLVNISNLLNQGSSEGRTLFFKELNKYSKLLDDSDRQLFLNFPPPCCCTL